MKLTKDGWLFLALTFALSWGLCGVAYAAGLRSTSTWFAALALALMFCPLASALILCAAKRGEGVPLKQRLGLRFRMGWGGFFLSWLLFPAAGILALGLALLLPGVSYDPGMAQLIARLTKGMSPEQVEAVRASIGRVPIPPALIALLQGMAAGISVNAVAAFGEEAGWRGFLAREQRGSSFWGASLFTGAVWGLWHAPIILQGHNYPEHPVAGVFMMVAWCVLLSPIVLYLRLKTKSAVAAAIAHGTLNGTAGVAIMPLAGGSDLTVGLTGAAGFAALGLLLLALWLADRRSERPLMARRLGDAD